MQLFTKKETVGWIIIFLIGFSSPYLFLITLILFIIEYSKKKKYSKTTYYKQTRKVLSEVEKDIGAYGEYLIYKYLKKYEGLEAKFLFNLYIPKNENETTEIDVLMISTKGLYVFESKNYSGWIFGSEEDLYWYQTLPRGYHGDSTKEKFYNPIKQNAAHIKALKEIIKTDFEPHSLIVFSNRCEFKNLNIDFKKIDVVYRFELPRMFKKIFEGKDELSVTAVESIYNSLEKYTNLTDSEKQKHIDDIKVNINRCPRCNGKLVERIAKQGENAGNRFYGCSNYPKCKYIKNIEE